MTALALAFPARAHRIARMSGLRSYGDTLRRRVPHILVLAFLVSAMDLMRAFPLLLDVQGRALEAVGSVSLISLFHCGATIAAITAAERTRFADGHRGLALVIAVALSAPVATALGVAAILALGHIGWSAMGAEDGSSLFLYNLWYNLVVGFLAAAYFTIWERASLSARRLRQAEIERQGAQQRVVESRLNVMKARVDPAFLFRMIGEVQALYRRDVDAAEGRLEDLIEYLRAALPQMRSGATSLGDEVRLAATYVRLHEDAFGGRLACRFDVDPSLDGAQFPPMALLPLVDDALRRAQADTPRRLALRVAATPRDVGLAVRVEDDCRTARLSTGDQPALVEHERAFRQFFGDGARIRRSARSDRGTTVELEVDHAIATRADR